MNARFDTKTAVWIIRLDKGENVIDSIHEWAKKENIMGGMFSAIGALENPVLAYYNLATGNYEPHEYAGIFEASMAGNLTLKDGKPFLHTHPTISGPDLKASMGHLLSATVGVTLECFITPLSEPLERELCPAIHLQHWKV